MSWVKLPRNFTQWQWYHDTNVTRVFIHILLNANHTERMWRDIVVGRGQHVTTIQRLADEVGLSKTAVRISLKKLSSTNDISLSASRRYTVITVTNYNDFNGSNNNTQTTFKQHLNDTQTTQTVDALTTDSVEEKPKRKKRATLKQHLNDTQTEPNTTTPIEYKNNIYIYSDSFNQLWNYYKKHSHPDSHPGEKKSAFKKYSILVKKYPHDVIAQHVEAYLNRCKASKSLTKHLTTFFNQHDFAEEIDTKQIKSKMTVRDLEAEQMLKEYEYFTRLQK